MRRPCALLFLGKGSVLESLWLPPTGLFFFLCGLSQIRCRDKNTWPGRDLNTQPSDLESDALPLRHQAMLKCRASFARRVTNSVNTFNREIYIWSKMFDPDVIWTRNLLIWSQTRYHCATRPCCTTSVCWMNASLPEERSLSHFCATDFPHTETALYGCRVDGEWWLSCFLKSFF